MSAVAQQRDPPVRGSQSSAAALPARRTDPRHASPESFSTNTTSPSAVRRRAIRNVALSAFAAIVTGGSRIASITSERVAACCPARNTPQPPAAFRATLNERRRAPSPNISAQRRAASASGNASSLFAGQAPTATTAPPAFQKAWTFRSAADESVVAYGSTTTRQRRSPRTSVSPDTFASASDGASTNMYERRPSKSVAPQPRKHEATREFSGPPPPCRPGRYVDISASAG